MTYKAYLFSWSLFSFPLSLLLVLATACNTFDHATSPADDAGSTTGAGGARGDAGTSLGGQSGATGGRGGSAGSGAAGAGAGAGGRGGASGSAGNAGTGGVSVGSCSNDKKDGTETGVDCGGTCAACPNYKINAPSRSNNVSSSCNGGNGYMCARQMLLSPEFKQAAFEDWGSDDPPFVYGVVGHDLDAGGVDANGGNSCCQCYQLIFESPVGASGLPTPKPMIVQAFNTAAGGGRNFDIYMAAGGFGANNGCIGGASPMYSMYPDLGGDYTGGVRASRYSQCANNNQWNQSTIASATCQSYIAGQCGQIQSTFSASNQSTSQASCIQSNDPNNHYHINWSVRAMRVECPTNLTRVTGCKLNSQGLPAANPAAAMRSRWESPIRFGGSPKDGRLSTALNFYIDSKAKPEDLKAAQGVLTLRFPKALDTLALDELTVGRKAQLGDLTVTVVARGRKSVTLQTNRDGDRVYYIRLIGPDGQALGFFGPNITEAPDGAWRFELSPLNPAARAEIVVAREVDQKSYPVSLTP